MSIRNAVEKTGREILDTTGWAITSAIKFVNSPPTPVATGHTSTSSFTPIMAPERLFMNSVRIVHAPELNPRMIEALKTATSQLVGEELSFSDFFHYSTTVHTDGVPDLDACWPLIDPECLNDPAAGFTVVTVSLLTLTIFSGVMSLGLL